MPSMIEVTCKDADVTRPMRRAALGYADVLTPYDDLVHLCHVILQTRPAPATGEVVWSVRLDLVLTDGRTVAAPLLDRHRWYPRFDEALETAFRELEGWLTEVAPGWRFGRRVPGESRAGEDAPPFDEPYETWSDLPEPRVLHGTHHHVG